MEHRNTGTQDKVIQDLEEQLEAKDLLIKNLQQNDLSSKELFSEMKEFEIIKLENQKLLEKLKSKEDVMLSLETKSMEMENQLKEKQDNILLLQHKLEATKAENDDVLGKWKADSNSLKDLQNRFQQVQNELFSMKKLPKANALEMQYRPDDKNWEADSAIASGVSSPAFNVNSQLESHDLKQNFVNELEIRNKELQENNIPLKSNCNQVQDELFQVDDELKLSLQK